MPGVRLDIGLFCYLEVDQIIGQSITAHFFCINNVCLHRFNIKIPLGSIFHGNITICPNYHISGSSAYTRRSRTWPALLFQTELGIIEKC